MSSIQLVKATSEYVLPLLELKNEHKIRKFSLVSHGEIPLDTHKKWFEKNKHKIRIILKDGKFAGDVRVDDDGEVSIRLKKEFRGQGIGTEVLKLVDGKLYAKIVPENEASIRLFEKSGFKKKYVVYERDTRLDV